MTVRADTTEYYAMTGSERMKRRNTTKHQTRQPVRNVQGRNGEKQIKIQKKGYVNERKDIYDS